MNLIVACTCGKWFRTDRKHEGKSTHCPSCASPLLLTDSEQEPAVRQKYAAHAPGGRSGLPCSACGGVFPLNRIRRVSNEMLCERCHGQSGPTRTVLIASSVIGAHLVAAVLIVMLLLPKGNEAGKPGEMRSVERVDGNGPADAAAYSRTKVSTSETPAETEPIAFKPTPQPEGAAAPGELALQPPTNSPGGRDESITPATLQPTPSRHPNQPEVPAPTVDGLVLPNQITADQIEARLKARGFSIPSAGARSTFSSSGDGVTSWSHIPRPFGPPKPRSGTTITQLSYKYENATSKATLIACVEDGRFLLFAEAGEASTAAMLGLLKELDATLAEKVNAVRGQGQTNLHAADHQSAITHANIHVRITPKGILLTSRDCPVIFVSETEVYGLSVTTPQAQVAKETSPVEKIKGAFIELLKHDGQAAVAQQRWDQFVATLGKLQAKEAVLINLEVSWKSASRELDLAAGVFKESGKATALKDYQKPAGYLAKAGESQYDKPLIELYAAGMKSPMLLKGLSTEKARNILGPPEEELQGRELNVYVGNNLQGQTRTPDQLSYFDGALVLLCNDGQVFNIVLDLSRLNLQAPAEEPVHLLEPGEYQLKFGMYAELLNFTGRDDTVNFTTERTGNTLRIKR
ncbi:MAG: hypothetical protein WD768_08730, partial [Phycisphaeraceae bacterium]